jgi:hypothetical protein
MIGNHSLTLNQSHIGNHINVGSQPGAKGAQFNGVAKHDALLQLKEFSNS